MAREAIDSEVMPALPEPPPPLQWRRFCSGALLVLVGAGALAGGLVLGGLEQRHAELHRELSARLELDAAGRAMALGAWLEGAARLGRRLSRSDLVRLFASEMALSDPAAPTPPWLADQMPYMTQLINDFTVHYDLRGAAIVGRDGRTFLVGPGTPPQVEAAAGWRAELEAGAGQVYGPVRAVRESVAGDAALVMDVLLPVTDPQAASGGGSALVAALAVTLSVGDAIARYLGEGGPTGADRVRLFQAAAGGAQEIVPGEAPRVVAMAPALVVSPGAALPYATLGGSAAPDSFAAGAPVPGIAWTVLAQVDAGAALAPLDHARAGMTLLAALVAGPLGLAFIVFWARQRRLRRAALARQHADAARRVEAYRRLLDQVGGALDLGLGVQASDGRYLFVSPAFAEALGLAPGQLVGRTEAELSANTAAAPGEREDGSLPAKEGPAPAAPKIGQDRHGFARATHTLRLPDGSAGGLLVIAPKSTGREGAGDASALAWLDALIAALAFREPALRRGLARFRRYALAAGRRLGLSPDQQATLELAARLAELGRLLSAQEKLHGSACAEAGERVEAALRSLQDVPRYRAATVAAGPASPGAGGVANAGDLQAGDHEESTSCDIDAVLPARILRVVDAFCGRLARGAGRSGMTPGQALYSLAQEDPERSDIRVLSALAAVIAEEDRFLLAAPGGDRSGEGASATPGARAAA